MEIIVCKSRRMTEVANNNLKIKANFFFLNLVTNFSFFPKLYFEMKNARHEHFC
jgi:hypothetical protein